MTRHALLTMLAGCPDGATAAALAQHGHTPELIHDAATAGLVRCMPQNTGNGALRFLIVRCFITDAGRAKLSEQP